MEKEEFHSKWIVERYFHKYEPKLTWKNSITLRLTQFIMPAEQYTICQKLVSVYIKLKAWKKYNAHHLWSAA